MDPEIAASISSIAAGVSALAAITTAVIAARSLAGSRRDSRDRSRPLLVAQLKKAPLSRGTIDFVVTNFGATSAVDAKVEFDPPLPAPETLPASDMRHWLGLRYARVFVQWPPGMTLSNIYRAGHDETAPVTVRVSYKGQDGRKYRDSFYLDPDVIMKETYASPGDDTAAEKRIYTALEVIAKNVDRRS